MISVDPHLRSLLSSDRFTNKIILAALWKKKKKKKKKTCSNVRNSSKGIEYTKGVPLLLIQTSGLDVYGGKNLLFFYAQSPMTVISARMYGGMTEGKTNKNKKQTVIQKPHNFFFLFCAVYMIRKN